MILFSIVFWYTELGYGWTGVFGGFAVVKNQVGPFSDHASGLGFLLNRANSLLQARMTAAISGHGMHLGQALILATLHTAAPDQSPLTQTRLSKLTGIEKSSLVLFLDDMEKLGWVQRQSHPSDRRAYVIALTSSGTKRYAAVSKALLACEQEILSFMSKSQRGVFGEFLTELVARLQ
jgi:DNA-binding MarR family transcriptional regulator